MKPITVLLVDDDEGLRNSMYNRFVAKGFKVEIAATGKHAVQKVKAMTSLDLIISDIKMPGMDGLSLVNELQSEIPGFKTPIILISGHAGADHVREAKRLGVYTVLVKPFKMEDLYNKIIECCRPQ